MTLEEVLNKRNAAGLVYASDLARWLGEKVWFSMRSDEREELQKKMTLIADRS